MIIKQQQRNISPYAASVMRVIVSKNTRAIKEEHVVLVQLITPHAIVRLTKAKIESTIKYLEQALKHEIADGVINRAINREYNSRIFTLYDRTKLHENFLANLKVARQVMGKAKAAIAPIDFDLPEDNIEDNPQNKIAIYFDPKVNDTRRGLTYCRFTRPPEATSISSACLEIGSGSTVCLLPIDVFQEYGHFYEWTLYALRNRFEDILEDVKNGDIVDTKPVFMKYFNRNDDTLFYTRVTDDGLLTINYEGDYDRHNSKVITECKEKTIFILENAIEFLNQYATEKELLTIGGVNVSVA